MKFYKRLFALSIFIVIGSVVIHAQTSVITYQGKLTEVGAPSNGPFDLTFKLFTTPSEGSPNVTVLAEDVPVTAGIFTVNLNFGTLAFTGNPPPDYFIEIAVRPGASTGAYTTLSPRQPLTSSPYSIRTLRATSADSLSPTCVLCVTDGQIIAIDGAKVTGTVPAANVALNVAGVVGIENGGTGSSLKNFVDLATNQRRIDGNKEFVGEVSVAGASGRFVGNGSGLTNVNATIADGSVTTPKLADGSVTAEKLASGIQNSRNLSLLGSRRWDLLNQRTTLTGGTPGEIAFDGTNIWTVNQSSGNVTKVQVSDGAVIGTYSVGTEPQGISFDGANIWVVGGNGNGGTITKLRASDGVSLGTFTVATFLRSASFDGANMWVSSFGGTTSKIRVSDGANLGSFPSGNFSGKTAFDGANIWILNSTANVTRLRAADGGSSGAFNIGGGTFGIAFDGANMWITYPAGGPSGTGAIKKIRALDGVTLGTFPVSDNPAEIAFDGQNIWIASNTGNYVTKLRASDGVELGRFAAAGTPNGIAFDGENMWVTSAANNTVMKLAVFR